MFDRIAPTYDKLNHLMSLGIDRRWRRKAVDALGQFNPQQILDIATGTGDFALLMARRIKPQHITGADISEGMMAVGRENPATHSGCLWAWSSASAWCSPWSSYSPSCP